MVKVRDLEPHKVLIILFSHSYLYKISLSIRASDQHKTISTKLM